MSNYISVIMNVFLLTVVLTIWLKSFAPRLGLIDLPDTRKLHDDPTPRCGGLAMFLALGLAALIDRSALAAPPSALFGIGLIVAVGLADDRWGVAPSLRLVGQVVAAYVLIGLGRLGFPDLGNLPGMGYPDLRAAIGLPLAMLLTVGLANSINMADGVDGLAGCLTLAALFWLGAIAFTTYHPEIGRSAVMVMAAVVGFLIFNLRHAWQQRATVFLGDAGSTALGVTVAYLILRLSNGAESTPLPILLWVAAVPAIDTLSLIVRRLAAGRSPFAADRQHLHHLVQGLGLSPGAATLAIAAVSWACGSVAFVAMRQGASSIIMLAAFAIPIAAHMAVVLLAKSRSSAAALEGERPLAGASRSRATRISEPMVLRAKG